MAVLKTKARKSAWHLVINGKVKFPINDKRHAALAKARINQAKPPLTASQKARVLARANKLLGTKKS